MDTSIINEADTLQPPRRKLLMAGAAGLVAGVAAPFLSRPSSAFGAEKSNGKILIAYYSRTGNTRELANQIQQRVGGDLFEVRTVHSYPKEYRATTDQAKREQEDNFRPQLTAEVQNMESCTPVFIGYLFMPQGPDRASCQQRHVRTGRPDRLAHSQRCLLSSSLSPLR